MQVLLNPGTPVTVKSGRLSAINGLPGEIIGTDDDGLDRYVYFVRVQKCTVWLAVDEVEPLAVKVEEPKDYAPYFIGICIAILVMFYVLLAYFNGRSAH